MIIDKKNTVLKITVLTYTPCDLTEISKSPHEKQYVLPNFRVEREHIENVLHMRLTN